MLSRAGGEIQLSGFLPSSQSVSRAKCSQFTCMQINRPDVLEIKASEDNDPVHIDIIFFHKFDSATHAMRVVMFNFNNI